MSTNMRELLDNRDAREAVPAILTMMGFTPLAIRVLPCTGQGDYPAALGDDLGEIASILEQAAITPGLDVNSPNVMNFATALRLYGPERFRRGVELEWTLSRDGRWDAEDERGTRWDIFGGGSSFGVTIADWDRPDWYVESLERAKDLVAEIVARPSFPRHLMEELGEMELPYD